MNQSLYNADLDVFSEINNELNRQKEHIELIASENFVSKAVLEAQGSVLTNKYAEGYPNKRYYGGCQHVDVVESIAIERAKKLFNCEYANVQPHSGASANNAALFAFLNPGDTILGMEISAGGHLTHGTKVSVSGKWFNAIGYGLDPETNLIDYNQIETLAKTHRPKLIISGFSAYSRVIDWSAFRRIADSVGAMLMADMAHIAGLVATNHYPSPLPYADFVTTTTHKTLRGPRGGMILSNNPEIATKINSAIFPGTQGGPLMHVIAAKAVAFKEALQDDFKNYSNQIIKNAKTMCEVFQKNNIKIVSNGTDCHLMLLDLTSLGINGKEACSFLEKIHITCNKNNIPNDPLSPFVTSGIRLGTPAMTSRGLKEEDFAETANIIVRSLQSLSKNKDNPTLALSACDQDKLSIAHICNRHPLWY